MEDNFAVYGEDELRKSMLGVYLPVPTPNGLPGPGRWVPDADPVRVRSMLARLGIDRGEIIEVRRFVASRPVVMVMCADGSTMTLKWPRPVETQFRRDSEVFWLKQLDNWLSEDLLRASFPCLLAEDTETGVVVLDAVAECCTLDEVLADSAGPSTEWWVRLAVAVGALHLIELPQDVRHDPDRQVVPTIPSSFHLTTEEYALGRGDEFTHYVGSLQSVSDELLRLRTELRASALIHYDLTGENVLVGNRSGTTPVRVVDWETSGVGDPMCDVGSLLSHVLKSATRHIASRTYDVSLSSAWGTMLPHAKRFLVAYQSVTGFDTDELVRAASYAGFCQFMSALDRLEHTGMLGTVGNLSLIIGQRILRKPELLIELLLQGTPNR